MARKGTTKAAEPVVTPDTPSGHQEHVETVTDLAIIGAGLSDERDLVNQLLGQVQMARSFARFADVVSLTKLQHIKETKMYRALAGKKGVDPDGNEIADVGTFDGFCQALGLSRGKVDEDLTNLRAFGEEALKSLSAIGAGYREMRQYRRLPEDEKAALLEVAKTGDKDSFIDLAETIIAKHAKEKAELTAKIEDQDADHAATEKVLVDRNKKLDKTQKALEKLQLRTAPWDERVAPFKAEITERQSIIDEAVARHLQAVEALDTWLNVELPQQPDYDPESTSMPTEILTVILHLDEAIERTGTLIANARNELLRRFSGDIEAARQFLLQAE